MKISISKIVLFLFAIGLGISNLIHETMHLLGARLIGLYAEIRSTHLFNTYRDTRPLTQMEHIVFYGSGGCFTALLFFMFSLRLRDPEAKLISQYVAIEQFTYSIFEAFTPKSFWGFGSMISLTAGLLFLIFMLTHKIYHEQWNVTL